MEKNKMESQLLPFGKNSKMRDFLKSPEAFMIIILLIVLLLEVYSLFNNEAYGASKTFPKTQVPCQVHQKMQRLTNSYNTSDERKNSLLPMI